MGNQDPENGRGRHDESSETERHMASSDEQVQPASDAPRVVRLATVKMLSERIQLLGVDRSGAYDHYNRLLAEGFPIRSYEIAILELVRQQFPGLRSYHEIGSGLGTLPFMLAHEGFAAVGVERDDRRHLTATTILRELSAKLPQIESNCRLIGAPFPDAVADLDVSNSMAILTDFVASQTPRDYKRLCRTLARYRYLLLDLQRFCVKRDARQEQEQLVEELAAHGLRPRGEAFDLGSEGCYWLFERGSPPNQFAEEVLDQTASTAPEVAASAVDSLSFEDRLKPVPKGRGELMPSPPATVAAPQIAAQPKARVPQVELMPMPKRVRRRRFGGLLALSALIVIGIPSLIAVAYYGFWASRQYVTTFQFAVRGPSQAAAGRAGTSSMVGPSAMTPDAFVVTDYINSPQAIADVEKNLDLKAIFSKPDIDFYSRLSSAASAEQLAAYWAKVVDAHYDLISGNVTVSVRAFTPQESLDLAKALTRASDQMFRRLNLQIQQDFVRIADDNLARAQQRLAAARDAMVAFREKSGLVEPERTSQSSSAIIDELRKQLVGFQAQYASIKAVSPNAPTLTALSSQISALEKQIAALDAQTSSRDQQNSSAVRSVTAEALGKYQSLDLDRQFTEKEYMEALALRNQAYVMAQEKQSYLALFVEPALPQKSLYPDRPRAIATVVLAAIAAWFVGMLIAYAVRDHLV